jgi:hypothetical protein
MVDLKDQDVLLEGKIGTTTAIIHNTPKYALKLGMMSFMFDLIEDEGGAKSKKAYKDAFPGNYTLEEYYCPKYKKFQYRIRFDTPEDKTIFLLRYG